MISVRIGKGSQRAESQGSVGIDMQLERAGTAPPRQTPGRCCSIVWENY
jgi:hypothetical protein